MSLLAFKPHDRRQASDVFLRRLQDRFGDRLNLTEAVRSHHGKDESMYDPILPDAVVFAHTVDEIEFTVMECEAHGVPLIPYGSGSSLEGHLLPVQGGISLDLSEMKAILSINVEDMTATVEPGVTRKQLNEALRDTGLFFPIDPGADASLGGMAATRASGTNAVRYGTMRENVVSLAVVTSGGRLVRTARRAKKSSAGYDLTRLFVGSEGTLGVIAEVTVRLYPQPEAVSAAIVHFPTVDAAVRAVIETIQLGVPVARVELLDASCVRALNAYSHLEMTATPALLFEFHGSPASVEEQALTVQTVASSHEGSAFEWALRPEDRSRLWAARHNAYFAGLQMRPGARALTTDVCVPISALAESIRLTNQDLEASALPSMIVGHVGDGNYHVMLLIDPDRPEELDEAEAINDRLVERAIALDGTCTGEHGVGLHKMRFLQGEHGLPAIDVMRSIKRSMDPAGIFNPGKIISLP